MIDIPKMDPKEIFRRLPPRRCGEADRRYMKEVLDSGFGNRESADMLKRFEEAFAKKFGAKYAITFNSGSGTMLACLLAAGVGPGDEVIVPTLTMAATAFVVIQCGAVPVFVDSDPATFGMDPTDVERKITEYTRAVIPVSIFGMAPDFDPILALAKRHRLTVVEDDAQCFLAEYKGALVGTIGNAASFSFQGSKHMTTGGDGGMVICDNEEYGRNIRKACVQGYATLGARAGSTMIPRDVRQDWAFQPLHPERMREDGYSYFIGMLQRMAREFLRGEFVAEQRLTYRADAMVRHRSITLGTLKYPLPETGALARAFLTARWTQPRSSPVCSG